MQAFLLYLPTHRRTDVFLLDSYGNPRSRNTPERSLPAGFGNHPNSLLKTDFLQTADGPNLGRTR